MAATTLFNGPMIRKKQVDRFQPSTYRVISEEAECLQNPQRSSTFTCMADINIIGQSQTDKEAIKDHRQNRPNPDHCGFLRHNCRVLCEPICDVYTDRTHDQQWNWWHSRTCNTPERKAEHTLNTTIREDYQYRGIDVPGNTRHKSNPNVNPATGIAPVNKLYEKDGKQRFWKEGISYEHQFNSRIDQQYPVRGRRHGAFVWDKLPQSEVNQILKELGYTEAPQNTEQFVDSSEQQQCPKSPTKKRSPLKPVSASKSVVKSPVRSPKVSKSAHPHLTSHHSSPKARDSAAVTPPVVKAVEARVETGENKPLSRSRTESILSMASQKLQKTADEQTVKLPPIAAL